MPKKSSFNHLLGFFVLFGVVATVASAKNPHEPETGTCTFTTNGSVMELDGDCTTDTTILIPDGMTLDGKNHTIRAVDPLVGFLGAVVKNGGTTAHVRRLKIDADNMQGGCKGGTDRLRGIMFEGASGTIENNTILAVNKGASGCQEGNGIEVRNAPFDGTHPNTMTVTVNGNVVENWQKTGIVANGDVRVSIHQNHIGPSATIPNLAANSIQVGFGAFGDVQQNQVAGNQWCGSSAYAATGILGYLFADGTVVTNNNIDGNADVGLYAIGNNGTFSNNRIFDEDKKDPDCNVSGYDWGIVNDGTGNTYQSNAIRDYELKVYDVENEGKGHPNIVIPGGPKALTDPMQPVEPSLFE